MTGSDKRQRTLQVAKEYDEKDAVASVLSVRFAVPERVARRYVDRVMSSGSEEKRRTMQGWLDKIRPGLADMEASKRRRYIRRLAWRFIIRRCVRAALVAPFSALPGTAMLTIAAFLYAHDRLEQTFKPLVADYQYELRLARREGRLKAFFVRIEYWWRFGQACGALGRIVGKLVLWLTGLD
jgi:hypothetical protein